MPKRKNEIEKGLLRKGLGDPRFDPDRFHLPDDGNLGFVPIPADPQFIIGTRKLDSKRVADVIGSEVPDREINDKTTPTQAFYIARYLVTVAQFRAFVEDKKYKIGDEDALRDPVNRPVRYVSWYEALAYCDWLNEALKTVPGFGLAEKICNGQWRVALPSELEWEKAARGGFEGLIFPWGDEPDANRANYADSNIGTTSAVGSFPPNAFGLCDIVGNVWEWTRSLWGKEGGTPGFPYPYEADDLQRENLKAGNDIYRLVRGGSWGHYQALARCAARYWLRPGHRYDDIGFRVVLHSSPVSSSLRSESSAL